MHNPSPEVEAALQKVIDSDVFIDLTEAFGTTPGSLTENQRMAAASLLSSQLFAGGVSSIERLEEKQGTPSLELTKTKKLYHKCAKDFMQDYAHYMKRHLEKDTPDAA